MIMYYVCNLKNKLKNNAVASSCMAKELASRILYTKYCKVITYLLWLL